MRTINVDTNKLEEAKTVLELLNEQFDENVKMRITTADRGQAVGREKRFTLPARAFERHQAYLIYYVVHEFTHCLGYYDHREDFKFWECKLLDKFGITIEYARAYPKALYCNGDKVYSRK